MAEIKFSMRTEALNVLVEFAKAFIDTKAQMVHLRNAHCVVHGHDLEVSLVNPHTAARVTVPIIEKIEDGTGFDIRVPKKSGCEGLPDRFLHGGHEFRHLRIHGRRVERECTA